MVYLTGITKGPKSYATLQCGPRSDDHVLLNSDLLYGVHGPRNASNTVRLTGPVLSHSCFVAFNYSQSLV
jgi:hypothetical protein